LCLFEMLSLLAKLTRIKSAFLGVGGEEYDPKSDKKKLVKSRWPGGWRDSNFVTIQIVKAPM
jgi:hypothetical protein